MKVQEAMNVVKQVLANQKVTLQEHNVYQVAIKTIEMELMKDISKDKEKDEKKAPKETKTPGGAK